MEKKSDIKGSTLLERIWGFFRKCIFLVLSFGPMPNHIAFIMDGNRRFAKNRGRKQGSGHRVGFATLISTLQYCYEMGVKYVTVYAFSIDNFKRKPDEVHSVMTLMQEKIDELLKEESIVNQCGIRINFWGDLKLLSEPVRLGVEKAMNSTAKNTGPVLSVCVAYTSTDEIMHSVEESCAKKIGLMQEGYANGCDGDMEGLISVSDLDQHLYTADCPDPDIVIRTSGETRLSNFLLWQTNFSHLQNPIPLWPEFSLRHLVWAILEYQKVYSYLEELRRKSRELFDRIIQMGHYTERKAVQLIKTIVGVVEACHSLGVMHRDLTENFLFASMDEGAALKATDFGLSIFYKPGHC